MIGDIARVILDFLVGFLKAIGSLISDSFSVLMKFLKNIMIWLGNLLEHLFQALIDLLVSFFTVIYDLIRGLLYLIYMIGVLAVKFFTLIYEVALLLFSFIKGIARTFGSLTFTPSTGGAGHGYSEVIGKVMYGLQFMQMDVVAYVLLFGIWIFTAFGVVQIFSNLR